MSSFAILSNANLILKSFERIFLKKISNKLVINKKISFQKCFDRDEILFKNNNLWISNKLDFMMKIIRNVHDQFFCAHSNMNKIEKFIKRYYYWFNMKLSIKRYIRNCHKCQRFKTNFSRRSSWIIDFIINFQSTMNEYFNKLYNWVIRLKK